MACYDPYLIHKSRDEHMLVKNLCGGTTEREKSFEQLLPSFNRLPKASLKVTKSVTKWNLLDLLIGRCFFFPVFFFEIISWEIKKNQLPWNINNMHFLKLRAKRPENRQSQKEFHLPSIYFQVLLLCCCCFREGFWVVAILERIPSFLSYFFISSTTPLGFRVPAFRIRTQRNVNMASWNLPIFNGGHVSLLQGGPKKKSLQWKFSRGPGYNYELISGWNIPSYALIGRFVFIAGDRSLNTSCSVVQPEDDSMS